MKINEVKIKSIITKSNLPEADFVINPYVGCQHACQYCYADFMKRFTGHSNENWGEFVDVKINAPDTINPSKIQKDALILFGSVTDPYQPIEAKYEITRKCLEKLLEAQPNIELLTKSPLILRDIDLLKKFKNLKVGISIGIFDEKLAKELEPYVASPNQRIDTLKKLNEGGIQTYLFVSPIFPEISDIPSLLDSAGKYIHEVMFENLNIRANNQKKILNFIKRNKPELEELYLGLPKNKSYWNNLKKEIIVECKSKGIKYKMFFHHGKNE
ncbi:radical SAM protein [Candidatus Pacearchaeota archaeon]|nr:radical SAM protein [Candidatus Pacearchaeota archaeon]